MSNKPAPHVLRLWLIALAAAGLTVAVGLWFAPASPHGGAAIFAGFVALGAALGLRLFRPRK